MHVVATAGHVDHGKSTLVRALTGQQPDRLAEEHRRGLSIELGYCWTRLGAAGDVAFVDVPGHERFLPTMLAGVGPVPAVLFVVAADDPWMPQAREHLAALDALGVSHGVVAITRSDLADPGPASARASAQLSATTLAGAPLVPVSARTGDGLDELGSRLAAMVSSLPTPDESADVRLWVDRRFTMKGSGTVVTGTLPAGRICIGDTLALDEQLVRVRGAQSLEQPVNCAFGVSRVALNLTGSGLSRLERGSALVTPDAWHSNDVVDVRIRLAGAAHSCQSEQPPANPLLHIGAASVSTSCRPLGDDVVRLRLHRALPLRIGDRALLRDPGGRRLWGVTVLDPAPPGLQRRGAAADRAAALSSARGVPDLESEVDRRGLVQVSLLQRIGVDVRDAALRSRGTGGWLVSSARARQVVSAVERLVSDHARDSPLNPGVPLTGLAERLTVPSVELLETLVRDVLPVVDGRVVSAGAGVLPAGLEAAVAAVQRDLAHDPFRAPSADRLRELGLDSRAVAAAAKAGRLLRLPDGIVLLPGADLAAKQRLQQLAQPFSTSQARVALSTSRRTVLPLLEHLDKQGITRRLSDDRRELTRPGVTT